MHIFPPSSCVVLFLSLSLSHSPLPISKRVEHRKFNDWLINYGTSVKKGEKERNSPCSFSNPLGYLLNVTHHSCPVFVLGLYFAHFFLTSSSSILNAIYSLSYVHFVGFSLLSALYPPQLCGHHQHWRVSVSSIV